MISHTKIDFKKYNADGIGSRPAPSPRVDFAALNQPWAGKSTTPMVLVHVHRFPNKQNHTRNPPKRNQLSTHNLPKRRQPSMRNPSKRNRRGGAYVPARTSAQRRFHPKIYALCAGNERWMRPCRATRAGTQAPPLPISIIFFHASHTNKITIYTQSTQTKSTVYTQSSPTTSNIQTRRVYNPHTHRGRKCIAHSRPHSLKQVMYANRHRDDALLF